MSLFCVWKTEKTCVKNVIKMCEKYMWTNSNSFFNTSSVAQQTSQRNPPFLKGNRDVLTNYSLGVKLLQRSIWCHAFVAYPQCLPIIVFQQTHALIVWDLVRWKIKSDMHFGFWLSFYSSFAVLDVALGPGGHVYNNWCANRWLPVTYCLAVFAI